MLVAMEYSSKVKEDDEHTLKDDIQQARLF